MIASPLSPPRARKPNSSSNLLIDAMEDDPASMERAAHFNQNAALHVSTSRPCTPVLSPYSCTPPTVEDWEDAYANERYGRLLVSFVLIVIGAAVNPLVLAVLHDFAPRSPLPDTVFLLVAEQPWARLVADILVTVCGALIVTICLIHRYRLIVARRTLFIASFLYLLRVVTLLSTQLPVGFSNATMYCAPEVAQPDYKLYFTRFFDKFVSLGTSVATDDLCGDLLFSGHTIVYTVCYLLAGQYLPRRLRLLRWLVTPLCFFGMTCLVICRLHYTIDVIIAFWLTVAVFTIYHGYAELPHEWRSRSVLHTLWLAPAICWFERPVPAGKLPNRCNWPCACPPGLNSVLKSLGDSNPLPAIVMDSCRSSAANLRSGGGKVADRGLRIGGLDGDSDSDDRNPLLDSVHVHHDDGSPGAQLSREKRRR